MTTTRDRVLLQTATLHLRALAHEIDRADPGRLVSARSRVLCAGLSCLARACYQALGGGLQRDAVGEAAAMLSLLTKIDDQVIDDLGFHGGPLRPRGPAQDRALDRRTRAHLQPTLDSLRRAEPVDDQPRCRLAAQLGLRLRTLAASPDRLAQLLDTIAFGWEVQVRAVRLLSGDPRHADPDAIAAVSADISGAWLLMITMIGALPQDAARPLTSHEILGFYAWGLPIQSADALADLQKDTADGLVASVPGLQLAAREPTLWRRAFVDQEIAALYAGVAAQGIDRRCIPSADERARLATPLAALGEVPAWLDWIHRFLCWRWLRHPLHPGPALAARGETSRRLGDEEHDEEHDGLMGAGWARWFEDAERQSASAPTSAQEARPCSAP